MKPLDELRDVFREALRKIPDDDPLGDIVKRMLIDKWNKEIDYIQEHYDFTYKKDSEDGR